MQIQLIERYRDEEDTCWHVGYGITVNGETVGYVDITADADSTYIERIDVNENWRNQGVGAATIEALVSMFRVVFAAPDNEDSQRLFERIGRETDKYPVCQGFGVYIF